MSWIANAYPQRGLILLPLKLRLPLRHGPAWTNDVDMTSESMDPIERWTAKRRVALVVSILKGETSVAEAEGWREKFFLGAENALLSAASGGPGRLAPNGQNGATPGRH